MTVSKSQRFIQIGHIWPTPNLFNKVSISTSAAAVYQIRTSLLLNMKTTVHTESHIYITYTVSYIPKSQCPYFGVILFVRGNF